MSAGMDDARRGRLVLVFLVSGAVGIQYEVLWLRIFTQIAGTGVHSVSAVITAFLLGLALGGWIFGRRVDRRGDSLRLYGWLELGCGLLHLAAFGLWTGFDHVYVWLYGFLPYPILKWLVFAVAIVFVTLPATLVGGTVPALMKYFIERGGDAARESGKLYAINTLGAAFGALALAHLVLPEIGYAGAVIAASLASVALGLVALAMARGDAPVAPPSFAPSPAERGRVGEGATVPSWAVLAAYTLSGFACLGYEVVWSRLLEFVFFGTLQSFATLLLLFLVGLAIGNFIAIFLERFAFDRGALLGALQFAAGVLALASIVVLHREGIGFAFMTSIVAITTLSGMTFPIAVRLSFRGVPVFGRTVGDLYSWNTAGSIAGSCVAGFVLVPFLGSQTTLVALAAIHLAVGVAVLARRRALAVGLGALGVVAVGGAIAAIPSDALRIAGYKPLPHRVIESRESELEVLAVLEEPTSGARTLHGGPQISGSTSRREVQIIQGHLAMLAHPAPQSVLEIGYGVGEILRAVNRHAPREVDLIEIDPGMIPIANEFFDRVNERSSDAPNVRTTIMDGRHFLAMTERRYDVIMSDTFFMVSAGASRLYTREHFANGARRLRPGGLMVIWLPLNMGYERVSIVLRTFADTFPHVLAWWESHSLFVLGSNDGFVLSPRAIEERFARCAKSDLELVGIDHPLGLLTRFRAGKESFATLVAKTHRDLDPALDFAPMGGYDANAPLMKALSGGSPACIGSYVPTAERSHLESELARFAVAEKLYVDAWKKTTPPPFVDWMPRTPPEVKVEDAAQAMDALERALDAFPHHLRARNLHEALGVMLARERPQERSAWLDRVLARHPLSRNANTLRAEDLTKSGQPEKAREHLLRVKRVQPYLEPDPGNPSESHK